MNTENTVTDKQLHTLQDWWQVYGRMLILLGLVGFGGLAGWTQWDSMQKRQLYTASDIYQRILDTHNQLIRTKSERIAQELRDEQAENLDVDLEDPADDRTAAPSEEELQENILQDIALLRSEHAQSVYGYYAALWQVRYTLAEGRMQEAEELLQSLKGQSEDPDLNALLILRLARVLHARDKSEEAMELLRNEDSRSLTPMFREALGDMYWDRGSLEDASREYQTARRLYREALKRVPDSLSMKMQELSSKREQ